MMAKTTSTAILLIASLAAGATAASAHPKLLSSSPSAGATLKTSPKEIRINFSEQLVPAFSGIEVKDGGGKPVSTGKVTFSSGDKRKIIVPVAAHLTPGPY